MEINEASKAIKKLYQKPNSMFSSQSEVEQIWSETIGRFNKALENENDPKKLENCIIDDPNWELSVEERIRLLEKAKQLGVSSKPFLMDYFGYVAAHLDPGPEKDDAAKQLDLLMNQDLS